MTPSSGLARRASFFPSALATSPAGTEDNIFVSLSPELIDELTAVLTPRTCRAYRNNLLHFYSWMEHEEVLTGGINKSIVETYLVDVYKEGAISLAYLDQILAAIR
jgi:hypothetical protein